MFRKFVTATAISGLMVAPAMAQATPPTGAPATPPAAQSGPNAAAPDGPRKFVTSQAPDQWLSSKFKGTDVLGTDDQKIGDVSDMLFDQHGKIFAYIVSVGGFLGMGAKDVALAPDAFTVVKGANGAADKLKIAMTKDQLKTAANFERYKAPVTTTGAGPGTGPGGLPPRSPTTRPPGSTQ